MEDRQQFGFALGKLVRKIDNKEVKTNGSFYKPGNKREWRCGLKIVQGALKIAQFFSGGIDAFESFFVDQVMTQEAKNKITKRQDEQLDGIYHK